MAGDACYGIGRSAPTSETLPRRRPTTWPRPSSVNAAYTDDRSSRPCGARAARRSDNLSFPSGHTLECLRLGHRRERLLRAEGRHPGLRCGGRSSASRGSRTSRHQPDRRGGRRDPRLHRGPHGRDDGGRPGERHLARAPTPPSAAWARPRRLVARAARVCWVSGARSSFMSRRLHERHADLREAEVCLADVKRAGSFRVALVYPNLYFVGMSNLGFQSVYQMLNAQPDVLCERAFLPDDVDTEELERSGQPARELSSRRRRFATSTWSRSRSRFENDYLHVLKMLRLAGIPLRAQDRGPRDPLVVLGGAAMFLNPEPLAPFADLIAVGEGEALVPKMMDALLGADDAAEGPRAALSRRTASTFPRATRCATTTTARWPAYDGPGAVIRQRGWPGKMPHAAVGDPDPAHRDVDEVHGRDLARLPLHVPLLLGRLQLPARCAASRAQEIVDARPRGAGDHEQDRPRLHRGLRPSRDRRHRGRPRGPRTTRSRWPRCGSTTSRPSSCSSSRTPASQGLTLAPECGSDRMRKILNKQFTNAEILDKATWIFENGIQNLKLYYMVGPALRGARRRRGHRHPHRADPRADARGGARARAHRPHPPVGEPLRAQARHALPVAAHGGPEGDRPQAPVPAQGLRARCPNVDAIMQERAHRRRAVGRWPWATGGWPTRSRSRSPSAWTSSAR